MKNKLLLLCFIFSAAFTYAQNYELSTLRIGPFNLKMDIEEADKIAGKKLKEDKNNYGSMMVNYHGEIIEVYVWESYSSDNGSGRQIGNLATKSKKFRTKSGMGVGSTRTQLIEAYKNFPSYCINYGWTDEGTISKSESYFTLTDNDANTELVFTMLNNVVTEVKVYFIEEGC